MLYRVELYGDSKKPVKIGNWVWTNKGKAIAYGRGFVENQRYTIVVRQQKNRKVVFRRPPRVR